MKSNNPATSLPSHGFPTELKEQEESKDTEAPSYSVRKDSHFAFLIYYPTLELVDKVK